MFVKKKDTPSWRKQLEDLTTDFFDAETAAEAVALFDDPERADQVVGGGVYRYFEEDEDPAELVWPIFSHYMDERGRIAMVDWSLNPRGWIEVFNRTLNTQGLAAIPDAVADEIIARATRRDVGETITGLQRELSAVLQGSGFVLMLDDGGQDAHIHYLAPTEAARRWDFKMIGRDMRLSIVPSRRA
jgi:hypothetical protein